VQAVVLSDYAKGVVSAWLVERLLDKVRKMGIPITADPKVENFHHYKRVTCVTPNLQEAMESAGVRQVRDDRELNHLGERLLHWLESDSVLITRGEHGMSLFEKKKAPVHIPTRAQEVFDVTGAGDTVIGTLTLALAAGAPLRLAAELANEAAGIVVGKLGTASVSPAELLKAVRGNHG
jgi:D-beta-D-heptose 7-phosphate kinase/D-beta-D-heptose 1-phosphate adenosyltransferase